MIFHMVASIFPWEHGICGNSRQLGHFLWVVVTENMKNEAKINQDQNEMILIDHSMIFQ